MTQESAVKPNLKTGQNLKSGLKDSVKKKPEIVPKNKMRFYGSHCYRFRYELTGRLKKQWPKLFKTPRPLSIGIYEQLAEQLDHDDDKIRLRRALYYWCNLYNYIKSVAAGGQRIGLNGPEGTVTDQHRENAKKRLAQIKRRNDLKALKKQNKK